MKTHLRAGLTGVLLSLSVAACSAPRTGPEVDVLLQYALRSSTERMAQGQAMESYQLARAVAEIDPRYPGVQEALAGMPADLQGLFEPTALGSNVALRQPVDARWYEHVLWYLPDRVLDIFDIVSFDVHLGFGIWVDAHATRALQVTAGFRTVGGFGWHDHRSLGIQTQSQAALNLLPFGAEGYSAMQAGTSGVRAGTWSEAGLHNPSSRLYQDYKDYWAIGGGATAVVAGAEVDVHPIEIFDFLVGWFLFDPSNDGFATTTGLALSTRERQLLRSLGEIAADKSEIEAYYIWRGLQEKEAEAAAANAAGGGLEEVLEADPDALEGGAQPGGTPEDAAGDAPGDAPPEGDPPPGAGDDPPADDGEEGEGGTDDEGDDPADNGGDADGDGGSPDDPADDDGTDDPPADDGDDPDGDGRSVERSPAA